MDGISVVRSCTLFLMSCMRADTARPPCRIGLLKRSKVFSNMVYVLSLYSGALDGGNVFAFFTSGTAVCTSKPTGEPLICAARDRSRSDEIGSAVRELESRSEGNEFEGDS